MVREDSPRRRELRPAAHIAARRVRAELRSDPQEREHGHRARDVQHRELHATAPAKVGVLLKEIRNQLDRVLAQKIENAGKDVCQMSNALVATILELLDSEKMATKPSR